MSSFVVFHEGELIAEYAEWQNTDSVPDGAWIYMRKPPPGGFFSDRCWWQMSNREPGKGPPVRISYPNSIVPKQLRLMALLLT